MSTRPGGRGSCLGSVSHLASHSLFLGLIFLIIDVLWDFLAHMENVRKLSTQILENHLAEF